MATAEPWAFKSNRIDRRQFLTRSLVGTAALGAALVIPGRVQALMHLGQGTATTGTDTPAVELVKSGSQPAALKCRVRKRRRRRRS